MERCKKCNSIMTLKKARPILDGGVFTYHCDTCKKNVEIQKGEQHFTREEFNKILEI